MNFYKDVVDELTQYFQNIDLKIDLNTLISSSCITDPRTGKLANSDPKWVLRYSANCLLERFLNLKKRQISQIKHRVMYSSEIEDKIQSKFVDDSISSVIKTIKKELEDGTNVNGRLSKLWRKLNTNDGMLNDWELYHFHLSNEREYPGSTFYKRTGKLLIAYIPKNSTEVYFLDIIAHKDKNVFSKQNYLVIIGRNWPDIIAEQKIQGIISTEMGPITDDERHELRKANATVIDTVNGTPTLMGLGSTMEGTSVDCMIMCHKIMEEVKQAENKCFEIGNNKGIPCYICFRLKLIDNDFVIIQNSGEQEILVIPLK